MLESYFVWFSDSLECFQLPFIKNRFLTLTRSRFSCHHRPIVLTFIIIQCTNRRKGSRRWGQTKVSHYRLFPRRNVANLIHFEENCPPCPTRLTKYFTKFFRDPDHEPWKSRGGFHENFPGKKQVSPSLFHHFHIPGDKHFREKREHSREKCLSSRCLRR